jgi:hypothetical protein
VTQRTSTGAGAGTVGIVTGGQGASSGALTTAQQQHPKNVQLRVQREQEQACLRSHGSPCLVLGSVSEQVSREREWGQVWTTALKPFLRGAQGHVALHILAA